MTQLYIGLMSGTSMDGIDSVVVSLGGDDKPEQRFKLLATHIEPIPATAADGIRALMHPEIGRAHV